MRWLRMRPRETRSPLERAVDRIRDQADPSDPIGLVELVAWIRPRRAQDTIVATARLEELTELVRLDAARADVLRHHLVALTLGRRHRYLYADSGIVAAEGLLRGTLSRLSAKWLPSAPQKGYLADLLHQVFNRPSDPIWVQGVAADVWLRLWLTLWPDEVAEVGAPAAAGPGPGRAEAARHARREIAEAINILSTRLHASATHNEVVRLHNDSDEELAIFDRLDAAARRYRDAICADDEAAAAAVHPVLAAAIADGERELAAWRRLLRRHGTTTSLSQQMLADGQMLARLRALVQITVPQARVERVARTLRLYRKLLEEQARDQNVRDLWQRTNRMLALQVTEHAGLIGGHYVAVTRSAWFRMIRAASGAGIVVAVMALIKQLIVGLHLPPLWNALAISTNYAIGFVVVHLLHLAIATKQPAMTAALIASTVQSSPSGKRSLAKLASLIIAIGRTQFIAIVFNVATAIPMGMALHWLAGEVLGPDWMPAAKAEHLIEEIDPIHSLALPHAAIAGVCLFLSGILAGYYNNLTAVTRIPERLARVGWLGWFGKARRRRIAEYVRANLGSLVGNATLGYLLGMAGFIGFLTGLPIDVRHVTLSASNLGLSMGSLGHPIEGHQLLLILIGLLAIGSINLAVSFTLALWTAFSANGIRLRAGARLWTLVWRRLRRSPSKLLVP